MTLSKVERNVQIEGLGLCEHCGVLLTIEDLPADAMDADWVCPKCKGLLTMRSFGYADEEGEEEQRRYVGPDGKWTDARPEKDFVLGNWKILVEPLPVL